MKGWGRRLARPQRQAGAPPPMCSASYVSPPSSPVAAGSIETSEQTAECAKFDLALVSVLSDGGCVAARWLR